MGFLSFIPELIGNIFDGGNDNPVQPSPPPAPAPVVDNTGMYVGIGVAAAAMIALVISKR